MYTTTFERFMAKVRRSETCWIWAGCLNNKGYGQLRDEGKAVLAHRVAFELFRGPIPPGMWVLHRCDNRRCVNPDHLFLGDCASNMQDCAAKRRLHFQRSPFRGEAHAQAKLRASDVRLMRELFRSGGFTKAELARRFGICPSQAGNILLNRHWKPGIAA